MKNCTRLKGFSITSSGDLAELPWNPILFRHRLLPDCGHFSDSNMAVLLLVLLLSTRLVFAVVPSTDQEHIRSLQQDQVVSIAFFSFQSNF